MTMAIAMTYDDDGCSMINMATFIWVAALHRRLRLRHLPPHLNDGDETTRFLFALDRLQFPQGAFFANEMAIPLVHPGLGVGGLLRGLPRGLRSMSLVL